MPKRAKWYISAVVLAGTALLVATLVQPTQWTDPIRFGTLLTLAIVASVLKVQLPGTRGTMSVNYVLLLICAAELPLAQTVLIAILCGVVQRLWRAKTRPTSAQILFNGSSLALSAAAASFLPTVLDGGNKPVGFAIAAVAYFACNSLLVSVVSGLAGNHRIMAVWREYHFWTFPFFLMGAVIAAVITLSTPQHGWAGPLLVLPTAYLIFLHYRIDVEKRMKQVPVTAG